ncbi:hypothetical protein IFVP136_C210067 [Vibrio parahaemolyticus]
MKWIILLRNKADLVGTNTNDIVSCVSYLILQVSNVSNLVACSSL